MIVWNQDVLFNFYPDLKLDPEECQANLQPTVSDDGIVANLPSYISTRHCKDIESLLEELPRGFRDVFFGHCATPNNISCIWSVSLVWHELFADDGVLTICNDHEIGMQSSASQGLEILQFNSCVLVG